MAKRKNLKADRPMFHGCITFDGTMQVKLSNGEVKTLRTDYGGIALHKANPNKELLVLVRNHAPYNEIDTGYIVRTKQYDNSEMPFFGLKHEPDADGWACHNYCDVVAWGYADGGLNDPTLFYSCQSTVEEEMAREVYRAEHGIKTHAERLAEMEAEKPKEGLTVKLRNKDGNIEIETSWPKAKLKDYIPVVENQLGDCMKAFWNFNEKHPNFQEAHFMTEPTIWDQDLEEEGE